MTDGTDILSFKYNSDGIRTKKTVNGTATEYFLNGSTILAQKTGNDIMWFYYDHSGKRIALEYHGEMYYYVYNAQGDVMYIADSNGYIVGGYQYDSWGKVINAFNAGPNTVATANPFRYRGYYYDSETELYYLNSRYYNPEWGRFVNADGIIGANDDIISTNLFAYCSNNPINGYDPTGEWNASTFMKGLSIALVGVTAIATVATAGCAAPLLIATVAVVSGAACIGFGAAEIAESFTDHNVIRDDLMGGNEQLYNTVRTVTEVTATVSTIAVNVGAAANKESNPLLECFIEGTLVLTIAGCVPIEEIKLGDLVMATNPETGETALKEVVQLFRNETNEWIHLTIDGEEITCTPEHPFYSPVKGWTAACTLKAGDILATVNGEYVVLEKIQHELLETPETTYNFEVEDFHTYYVGDTEVLVHNLCKQKLVAGSKDGWNAKVSIGGESNHALEHAHIFWKNQKLASIDVKGNILIGDLPSKGIKFVKKNLPIIVDGIVYYYNKR